MSLVPSSAATQCFALATVLRSNGVSRRICSLGMLPPRSTASLCGVGCYCSPFLAHNYKAYLFPVWFHSTFHLSSRLPLCLGRLLGCRSLQLLAAQPAPQPPHLCLSLTKSSSASPPLPTGPSPISSLTHTAILRLLLSGSLVLLSGIFFLSFYGSLFYFLLDVYIIIHI